MGIILLLTHLLHVVNVSSPPFSHQHYITRGPMIPKSTVTHIERYMPSHHLDSRHLPVYTGHDGVVQPRPFIPGVRLFHWTW